MTTSIDSQGKVLLRVAFALEISSTLFSQDTRLFHQSGDEISMEMDAIC
jgi:hypothetical protein